MFNLQYKNADPLSLWGEGVNTPFAPSWLADPEMSH